ncbi:hypothetical protein C0J52_08846 [Blattella germanica]|nr:hypothetical protein C0J52_08846 [Blattella germanica]
MGSCLGRRRSEDDDEHPPNEEELEEFSEIPEISGIVYNRPHKPGSPSIPRQSSPEVLVALVTSLRQMEAHEKKGAKGDN